MEILNIEPEAYGPELRQRLSEIGNMTVIPIDQARDVIDEFNFDAIIMGLQPYIDAELLDNQPDLLYIVSPTTGLDHIDVEECKRRGIKIISLKGETALLKNVHATAEHTWALLLALVRRMTYRMHRAIVEHGEWKRPAIPGTELWGKKIGIIGGYGRVGSQIRGYCEAFGVEWWVYDRDSTDGELESLLKWADIITLHLPLNKETHGFMSRERINMMKPHALLINTARGELIDEVALLDALSMDKLGGAALDVLSGETKWDGHMPFENELRCHAKFYDNLILTPHIGGYTKESIMKTREFIVEKFIKEVKDD